MFKTFAVVFITFLVVMQAARARNLTAVTWSHATNSQRLLNEVLASDINFIEADIVYGYLLNDTLRIERQPVMAHPPANESDISLRSFLEQIWAFNDRNDEPQWKGVKLDFKSTEVFQVSLDILREMWSSKYEIWINADIFSGPLESTVTPVNSTIFLEEAKKFENATLSTGWTTRWGPDFSIGSYTMPQVTAMRDGIAASGTKNPITFPVRAGIAAQSINELDFLYKSLRATNDITFTIWSGATDWVDVEQLRHFIFHFGLDKIFIDVPAELESQLRLDQPPNHAGMTARPLGLVMIAALSLLLMMA